MFTIITNMYIAYMLCRWLVVRNVEIVKYHVLQQCMDCQKYSSALMRDVVTRNQSSYLRHMKNVMDIARFAVSFCIQKDG